MRSLPRFLGSLSLLVGCLTTAACTEEDTPEQGISGPDGSVTFPDSSAFVPTPTPTPGSTPAPTTTPAPTASSDIPCDVQAVLTKNCVACHAAGGSAQSPLLSRADFSKASKKAPAKTVSQLAGERIVTTTAADMMPPAGYPRLEGDDLAKVQAWLTAGTPARTGAECTPGAITPNQPAVPEGATCFKMLAHNGDKKSKYKVGAARDQYINMSFAAPWGAQDRYAISMRPVTDNAAVIHHWLLFEEAGVDGAILPGTGAHPAGQLLTGWAPGGDGIDLIGNPDDVGYELRGNTSYVLEFHYNSSDPNAEDASGVEICMMDHKPKNIAALSWLGWDNLGFGSRNWWGLCTPTVIAPIHIVGVTPHMHKSGNRMRGIINRANGMKETLHDLPFQFDYQQSYKKDVIINAGDTITTDCWFDKDQSFGHGTEAEMCYLFTYAYPKGALADVSVWGGVAHGGSSCMSTGGTR